MAVVVKAGELRGRNAEQQVGILLAAYRRAKETPVNGEMEEVDVQVMEFETRYRMSSEALIAGLDDGSIEETDEICTWLFVLDRRGRLHAIGER